MPTVPRYNRQVQETATPNVQVSTNAPIEAFGGGQAADQATRSIAAFGETVDQVYQKAKREADEVAKTKAWAELTSETNNLMLNDKDGVVTRKNQDAFNVTPEYTKRFNDAADRIEKGLANRDQRVAFQEMRIRIGTDFNQRLLQHENSERQKFDQLSTETAVETAQNDAALNWGIPGKIEQSLQIQESVLRSFAERNDIPKETIDLQIERAKSKSVTSTVQNMLAGGGNDLTAQNFYKHAAKNGWLTAEDDTQIQSWLETATTRADGQRFADNLINKNVSYSEGIQKIQTIQDPKVRQQARNNFTQYHADIEHARDLDNKRTFENAFDLAASGMDPDLIPAPQWSALKPAQKKAIEKYTDLRRNGVVIQTDEDVKNILMDVLSNPATRSQANKLNLLEYRDKLSEGDYKEISELQNGIIKNDSKAMSEVDQYLRTSSQFKSSLADAGIRTDKKSGKKKATALQAEVWKRSQEFYKKNGRWPSEQETQETVDNLLIKVTRDDPIFNTDIYAFEAKEGDTVFVPYKNIPEKYRVMIESGMRERGLEITEESVADRYANWLRNR